MLWDIKFGSRPKDALIKAFKHTTIEAPSEKGAFRQFRKKFPRGQFYVYSCTQKKTDLKWRRLSEEKTNTAYHAFEVE